ncbi:hypothetical protein KNO81_12360 [Paraburkholderia sediminicola]|nr:hypothetical protein [Paraburkholderia sediminicola]
MFEQDARDSANMAAPEFEVQKEMVRGISPVFEAFGWHGGFLADRRFTWYAPEPKRRARGRPLPLPYAEWLVDEPGSVKLHVGGIPFVFRTPVDVVTTLRALAENRGIGTFNPERTNQVLADAIAASIEAERAEQGAVF